MYNTKVVCTYHTDDIFIDSDKNISQEERQFIQDSIYRQELLNILDIEDFNEVEMGEALHELYVRLHDCLELNECMSKLAGQFISEDKEIGLTILFAYDYMYLTHQCISEYLETGTISEINIKNLRDVVY
jgi:hypothetical protein